MSVASGLLQAALGVVALLLVWHFDLRERFEVIEWPGPLRFDPGVALLYGSVFLVAFGIGTAVWSAVGNP